MRIWLNPDKLHGYGMSAADVLHAVRAQNVQFASGSIGAAARGRRSADHRHRDRGRPLQLAGAIREHHPAHRARTAPPCG